MENICSSVSRDANSRLFCFYPPNRRRGDRNTNTGGVRFIHRSWLLNLLKPRNTLPRRFEDVTQRTVKKDATYNTIKSSSHCGSRQLFCKTCKNDATTRPVWKLRSNRSNISAKLSVKPSSTKRPRFASLFAPAILCRVHARRVCLVTCKRSMFPRESFHRVWVDGRWIVRPQKL